MFLLNSRLGLFSATTSVALLLPKLRSHFAEFLNEGSLARLRFLTPPTCVGLRYGHLRFSPAAFLDSVKSVASVLFFPSPSLLGLPARRICLSYTLAAWTRSTIHALDLSSCVTASLKRTCGGIGFSTDFPSSTPFGLDLGPDLPWADEPSPGILRFSADKILTCLFVYSYWHSLLYPLHSISRSSFYDDTMLPYPARFASSQSFGGELEPRYIFGAEPLDQ